MKNRVTCRTDPRSQRKRKEEITARAKANAEEARGRAERDAYRKSFLYHDHHDHVMAYCVENPEGTFAPHNDHLSALGLAMSALWDYSYGRSGGRAWRLVEGARARWLELGGDYDPAATGRLTRKQADAKLSEAKAAYVAQHAPKEQETAGTATQAGFFWAGVLLFTLIIIFMSNHHG